MDGGWSFLGAQVEQVELEVGGVTRWNAMNVGNLATLPGNAAFVLEPVAWGQEVVAGALVQAQGFVAAPVMVPAGIAFIIISQALWMSSKAIGSFL